MSNKTIFDNKSNKTYTTVCLKKETLSLLNKHRSSLQKNSSKYVSVGAAIEAFIQFYHDQHTSLTQ